MCPWSPPRHPKVSTPRCAAPPSFPGSRTGPWCWSHRRCRRSAIAAYAGPADAESALTAYDAAAEAVAEGFSAKAARASGAATEVLTASAGLTRDKGLRQAVAGRVEGGTPLLEAVHEGVAQFVDIFTAMGGLMAERATDLLDIERRLVARLVGEPEPGVVLPDVAVGARRRATSRPRTPPASTRPGARAGDREGRRHQPHRDHRAPARHPVRGGRCRCARAAGR